MSTAPGDRRRSSAGEQMASAARRISITRKLATARPEVDEAKAELGEQNREQRRRDSLRRMFVTDSGRSLTAQLLKDLAQEGDVTGTPVERLQQILTKAKERGMSAERLFEYFAPDGEASITPTAFESALRQLASFDSLDVGSAEARELMETFDKDKNGTIELSEFMEFCFGIPTLAWKAERARRLGTGDSTGSMTLVEAARNAERRRSSLRAVERGDLLHEGSKLFWRTKEDVDLAIYENADEGLLFLFCRSHNKPAAYPPIFIEGRKVPVFSRDGAKVLQAELSKKGEAVSEVTLLTDPEWAGAVDAKRRELVVEYLLNRLKVPDGVNVPETTAAAGNKQQQRRGEGKEDKDSKELEPDEAAAAAAAAGCPFLQRLSTDTWETLVTKRSVLLDSQHRFPTRRRASMQDFRRASAEFERVAKETAALSLEAEDKANDALDRARRASRMDTGMAK